MDKTVALGNNGGSGGVDIGLGNTTPETFLRKGHLLKNRYKVLSVLGQGGFGLTYACHDTTLNLKVAVKEYYPDGFVNRDCKKSATVTYSTTPENMGFIEKGLRKFIDEARILAKFSGEDGIVDVRDYFEENNTAYIVMEYLDGKDLRQIIKEKGVMPADYAVRLLLPVMESLEKVHRQGLIHRDISPDNIRMVGKKVKLLDFGAARDYSFEGNKTMTVMLKRGYAPIEQYGAVDSQGPWTDVYALCATLYLCITGKKPADSLIRWENDPLRKPSQLGVSINPAIENVIMKGLSVSAKDRFQSMKALAEAFGKALKGINTVPSAPMKTTVIAENSPSGKKSVPVGNFTPVRNPVSQPVASAHSPIIQAAQPMMPENKKSKNKLLVPIIAVVLVVAIVAGILVWRGGLSDSSEPVAESTVEETQSDGKGEGLSTEDSASDPESETASEFLQATDADIARFWNEDDVSLLNAMSGVFTSGDMSTMTSTDFFEKYFTYCGDGYSSIYQYYFGEIPEVYYSENPDPRGIFDPEGPDYSLPYYYCYPAGNVDWIMSEIFNITPDHREGFVSWNNYYEDGYYYLEAADGLGGPYDTFYVDSYSELEDGRYQFNINCGNWLYEEGEIVATAEIIAGLKEIDGNREWVFYRIRVVDNNGATL